MCEKKSSFFKEKEKMSLSNHLEFVELRQFESVFVSVGVGIGTLIAQYIIFRQRNVYHEEPFVDKLLGASAVTSVGAFLGGTIGLCFAITWPRSAAPIIGTVMSLAMN